MARPLTIGAFALSSDRPGLVAAGGETELDALAAADAADVVELRADLAADPHPDVLPEQLGRLRRAGRAVILTARAATEGGQPLDEPRRRALYVAGLPHADAIDVEIASSALVAELVPQARARQRLVILSAHVLDRTPDAPTLRALVDRARALGADVVKLATQPRQAADLRVLIEVTLAERDVVTLALGAFGPLSRVVLPAAGSLLTYGHVGRPTASGQLAVPELRALLNRLLPT